MIRLLPVAIGGVLVSQTVVPGSWESFTALTFLGVVLVWMVSKTLPSLHTQIAEISKASLTSVSAMTASMIVALEKLDASQERYRQDVAKSGDQRHEDEKALALAITELRQHCTLVKVKQDKGT